MLSNVLLERTPTPPELYHQRSESVEREKQEFEQWKGQIRLLKEQSAKGIANCGSALVHKLIVFAVECLLSTVSRSVSMKRKTFEFLKHVLMHPSVIRALYNLVSSLPGYLITEGHLSRRLFPKTPGFVITVYTNQGFHDLFDYLGCNLDLVEKCLELRKLSRCNQELVMSHKKPFVFSADALRKKISVQGHVHNSNKHEMFQLQNA